MSRRMIDPGIIDAIMLDTVRRLWFTQRDYKKVKGLDIDCRDFNPPAFMNELRQEVIDERASWVIASQIPTRTGVVKRVYIYAKKDK